MEFQKDDTVEQSYKDFIIKKLTWVMADTVFAPTKYHFKKHDTIGV